MANVFRILVSLLFFQCNAAPIVIAHRGASSEAPENTISAFQRAIETGADWIELDVHLSNDGIPVVIHDDNCLRTCALDAHVLSLCLQQLKKLDAGSWFSEKFHSQRIPTLEEILLFIPSLYGIMIEIKAGSASPLTLVSAVRDVIERCRKKRPLKLILGSNDLQILHQLNLHLPNESLIGIVFEPYELKQHLSDYVSHLALPFKMVNKKLIQNLGKKYKLWTFTVNEEDDMARLIQADIDGIITNDPHKLVRLLESFSR